MRRRSCSSRTSRIFFATVPERVALTLSGHTHGGQVRILGYSPLVPSDYGNRYAYGHVVEAASPSRGLGRHRSGQASGAPRRAARDRSRRGLPARVMAGGRDRSSAGQPWRSERAAFSPYCSMTPILLPGDANRARPQLAAAAFPSRFEAHALRLDEARQMRFARNQEIEEKLRIICAHRTATEARAARFERQCATFGFCARDAEIVDGVEDVEIAKHRSENGIDERELRAVEPGAAIEALLDPGRSARQEAGASPRTRLRPERRRSPRCR